MIGWVAFLSAFGYAISAALLAYSGNGKLALAYGCWSLGNVALAFAMPN